MVRVRVRPLPPRPPPSPGDLSLYKNRFTGPIPEWTPIGTLRYLDLGHNLLTGNLTESLLYHRNLRDLYLNDNHLTGTIPPTLPTLGNLKLRTLHLNSNQLTGPIPEDWTNGLPYQKHLLALRLEDNGFCGGLSWRLCGMDVREGMAEMVELGADCSVCTCDLCLERCTGDGAGVDCPYDAAAEAGWKEKDNGKEKQNKDKGW